MVLRTIYRTLFFSTEANIIYFARRQKHQNHHIRNLLDGALPVFVAASISRGIVSFISAITESAVLEIILNVVYALVISQSIGY